MYSGEVLKNNDCYKEGDGIVLVAASGNMTAKITEKFKSQKILNSVIN